MNENLVNEVVEESVQESIKTLPFGKTTIIAGAAGFVLGVVAKPVCGVVCNGVKTVTGKIVSAFKKDSTIDVEAKEHEVSDSEEEE